MIRITRIRMVERSLPMLQGSYGWITAGYLSAYVALDWVSYIYPVAPPLAITPWNPPPGLSLALLLRYGPRNGPWLFVAALAAEVLVRGAQMSLVLLLLSAALPAVIYTALAVLLCGPFKFRPDFTTLRDATIFCATVAAATGLLALVFVGLFYAQGFLPEAVFTKSPTKTSASSP